MTNAEAVIGWLMWLGFTGLMWWLMFGIARDPKERAQAWAQFKNGMRNKPMVTSLFIVFFLAFMTFLTGLSVAFFGIWDPPSRFYVLPWVCGGLLIVLLLIDKPSQ